MHWPSTPVEHLSGFQPHFCPRRSCPEHTRKDPGYRFRRRGFYTTSRRWRIPRFRCLTCRGSFSRQSFAVSYYSKRPELLVPVAAGLVAGSAHRQIARSTGCAPSTVTRMAARLGRHALLLLARARSEMLGSVDEPLVLDHFETFESTQDYPFGVATLVGSRSWFIYDLDPAPHRRTGKINQAQLERLADRPRRRTYGGYLGSSRRVLARLLALVRPEGRVCLRGDGHKAYDRAASEPPVAARVVLERYPNPPRGPKGSPRSPEARLRDARLFPVDLLHKIVRHAMAHNRRETIAFGRRLNAMMERFFVMAVWRNFVQRKSERRRWSGTPAMEAGLTDEAWPWTRVFSRRLFPARTSTPATWAHLYKRLWTTPLFPVNSQHRLIRAF
jgi:transposase-like protein